MWKHTIQWEEVIEYVSVSLKFQLIFEERIATRSTGINEYVFAFRKSIFLML